MTIILTVEGAGNDGGVPGAWGGRRRGRGRWRLAGRVGAGVLRRRRSEVAGHGRRRELGRRRARAQGQRRGRARGRRRARWRRREREWAWVRERRRRSCRSVKFNFFAECPRCGTRQRFLKIKIFTLPSAPNLALGKDVFAECLRTGTRQSLYLGF
jgi:hypothetical protein